MTGDAFAPGTRVGRNRLQSLLGEGATGLVFKAVTDDGEEVAVKVLRPERTQHAVEIAHVDSPLARELGELLEQLVPVRRALRQKEEERRLAEALDTRAHRPLTGADAPARAGSAESVAPHREPTCK